MSAMSDYLETALLNYLFRQNASTISSPTSVYVALHTATQNDAGTGTEVSATGTNYSRATCSTHPSTGVFTTAPADDGAGAMQVKNQATITFPTPSASWGTVTDFSIWDAASGGNMLVYGALASSKTIGAGDTVQFAANQLTIKLA